MALWTLLLIFLGATSALADCPQTELLPFCTCEIISLKYKGDFPVVSCENIYSEEILLNVLSETKGEDLFEFRLVNSRLNFIPHSAFWGTTYQVLKFENSSISALSDSDAAFEGLENTLALLEIENCSFLTNWDWTQLSHLKRLMEISVTESDLSDVGNGIHTIHHLEFKAIVLRKNNIQWLDSHIFAPFRLLSRITLDFNHIRHIERTMFPMPAENLKVLSLSYNQLTDLPQDIFVQMPALTSLYLNGNPLQVIDELTFKPIWYQLTGFYFFNTKLSCDCRLTWITKTDLQNSKIYIHSECYGPPHLKGRKIEKLQPHELLC